MLVSLPGIQELASAPDKRNAYAGAIDHISAEIIRAMTWVQTLVSIPFLNAFVMVDMSLSEFP
jgi:hypothetical protein